MIGIVKRTSIYCIKILLSLAALSSAGLIHHGSDDGDGYGHGHATSYQHVNIENYHPVPVYLKKEHSEFLEHPVSKGHTATSVEVHHGGHHDPGYALVSGTHEGGHEHEAFAAIADHGGAEFAGHDFGGHEAGGFEHGGDFGAGAGVYEEASEHQGHY